MATIESPSRQVFYNEKGLECHESEAVRRETYYLETSETKCVVCGRWEDDETIVWIDDEGNLTTDTGKPYCPSCAPEQKD